MELRKAFSSRAKAGTVGHVRVENKHGIRASLGVPYAIVIHQTVCLTAGATTNGIETHGALRMAKEWEGFASERYGVRQDT